MGPVIAGVPASYLPGLLRAAERRRRSHRAVLRAGPGPLPRVRHLPRWVRQAREAGLDDESIESLLRVTLHAAAEEEEIA